MQKEYTETEFLVDDEEKDAANELGSETKTDIVVKSDGSRVLIVTVNVGGMETTMSLEISKPTNELNDMGNKNLTGNEQAAINADDLSKNIDSNSC